MSKFKDNLDYVAKCLEQIRVHQLSVSELGKFLEVNRMTAYGWQIGKHTPKKPMLNYIADKLKQHFGWDISADELLKENINKKFNVDHLLKDKDEEVYIAHKINIDENLDDVGRRIRDLRLKRGMTLNDLSDTTKKWFPNDKTYQISHTHIGEIERGLVKDYHVNRIRAMATVLCTNIEYILFNRESNNKLNIDIEKGLMTIPLSKELTNRSDTELKSLALKVKELLTILDPSIIKTPSLII